VSAVACTTVAPEEKVVKDFFRASKIRDNAALGASAIVSFEPRTEGTVQSLKFVGISPERSAPLQVKQFDEAFDKVKAAEEAFTKEKNAYQKSNIKALERILDAEKARKPVAKADVPVQTAWAKYVEDMKTNAKAVSDARVQLSNAKALAELSLSIPNGPTPDVTHMTGDVVAKDVTVDAEIKTPDGQTAQKQLIVTLERAVVKKDDGQAQNGRWIVTKVRDAAAGKTS
jgi:transcription elongation GreA/GreB family factor